MHIGIIELVIESLQFLHGEIRDIVKNKIHINTEKILVFRQTKHV